MNARPIFTHEPHSAGIGCNVSSRTVAGSNSPVGKPVMLKEFLERVVAGVFGIDTVLLSVPTRGRQPVAEARQVAMYLAHVSCSLSFTDVGVLFGRDRTTVAHACRKVEDRREDVEFDAAIELLERTIRMIHLAEDMACHA